MYYILAVPQFNLNILYCCCARILSCQLFTDITKVVMILIEMYHPHLTQNY